MLNVTQTFLPPLDDYVELLKRIWDSKWLTNRGPMALELEQNLEAFLGVQNLLLVNNGTIALQIAIKAMGLSGEIITTPFSYVATVSSIVWENCTPVFVDIDPVHLTIDETKIEEAITEKTSAILATHVYGNPCNIQSISEIAIGQGLKVIYDAAHCFGVKYNGESIVNAGDVSTLSFHATKLFHTAEGGAIICNDPSLADAIYYHHNFGHRGQEEFAGLGVNGKISELSAAMGLAVLPYMEEIVSKRRAVCDFYDSQFSSRNVAAIKLREGTEWNYSYYPLVFSDESVMQSVKTAMNAAEIFPRRYFYPTLNFLPYFQPSKMPVAEDISRRVLCLPLSAEVELKQQQQVAEIVKAYV